MTIWPAPCPCCGAIATLSRHLFVLSTFCPQESHSFSTGLSTEQKQQKAPCIPTDVRGRREKTCRQRISMCLSVVNFIVYYAHFCQFRVREQSNPCMLKGRQKAEFFEKKGSITKYVNPIKYSFLHSKQLSYFLVTEIYIIRYIQLPFCHTKSFRSIYHSDRLTLRREKITNELHRCLIILWIKTS